MNKIIIQDLESILKQYKNGEITETELNNRLSEIKSAIKVINRVQGQIQSCPMCHQPMYKHHIC